MKRGGDITHCAAEHRLRKRYRELSKEEVAQTLSDPAMVEEELAVMLGAFG
jgi:hypothetical protein